MTVGVAAVARHTYTYAWYAGESASGTAISGATGKTYTFPKGLGPGAHTYTVRVTATLGDQTATEDKTFTVTVNQAAMPSVTVAPYNGVYDGLSHNKCTVSGYPAGSTVTYSEDGTNFSNTMPTVKDRTSDSPLWVRVEHANYAAWTSAKLTAVVTAAKPKVTLEANMIVNYTDSAISYNGTVTLTGVNSETGAEKIPGAVSYQYKLKGDETVAPTAGYTAGMPQNVGKYWMQAKTADGGNYAASEWSTGVRFTILQGSISPTVSITGWTYGEKANAPTVSGNSGNGNVTYSYKLTAAGDSAYTATVPKAAGSYTVKAAISASANYLSGEATTTFTIAQKAYGDGTGFTISNIADQAYTGSAITPEPVVSFGETLLDKGEDYILTHSDHTAMGTNTAKVTISFQGNFSGSAEKTFSIVAAKLPDGTTNDAIFTMPAANEKGWHSEDITLTTKNGWTVSTDAATWDSSVKLSTESTKDAGGNVVPSSQSLFVKNGANVYLTTVTYLLDKVMPTVTVEGMDADGVNKIWGSEKTITIHISDAVSCPIHKDTTELQR